MVYAYITHMFVQGNFVEGVGLSSMNGLSAGQILVTLLLSQGVQSRHLLGELVYFIGPGHFKLGQCDYVWLDKVVIQLVVSVFDGLVVLAKILISVLLHLGL